MDEPITTILCKKYFNFNNEMMNIHGEFVEGNYYNKFDLEIDSEYKYIYIYFNIKNGIRFSFIKNDYIFKYFYDYFYDNTEIRKIKLKKISYDTNRRRSKDNR